MYALRNAAEDLTQFEDYKKVLEVYTPSAYAQYSLGEGLYAKIINRWNSIISEILCVISKCRHCLFFVHHGSGSRIIIQAAPILIQMRGNS